MPDDNQTATQGGPSDLHRRLRDAILALALTPGDRLSERGLEAGFGGSRTPVRAALLRLESEGLVRRDGRGWRVAPIDLAEIRAIYEYRELLESAAAGLAARRASLDDLSALLELADSTADIESPEHTLSTGTSFHLELARLSGNSVLREAMEGVLTRLYRTRWLEVQSAQSRERAHREHVAIARALLDARKGRADGAAASTATAEHVRGTGERLIASLDEGRQRIRAGGIPLG